MASSVTTTEAVVEPPPKTMEVPAAVPPPNTPEPPAAAPLPKVSEVPAAVPPVSDPLEAEKPGSNLAVAALSRKRSSAVSSEAAQKKFSILKKEGRIAKKLMEYYDSKSNFFTVEFRPNKRKSDGEWMTSHKLSPEDSWTSVKRIEVRKRIRKFEVGFSFRFQCYLPFCLFNSWTERFFALSGKIQTWIEGNCQTSIRFAEIIRTKQECK